MSEPAAVRFRHWNPRGVLCAVCRGLARGYGWYDPVRTKWPRPSVWFCCKGCQDLWTRLAREYPAMVDLTDQERAAIRATVRLVGEIMEEIGWDKRLADLSEPQVLTLIEVAVDGFQHAMRALARGENPEVPF